MSSSPPAASGAQRACAGRTRVAVSASLAAAVLLVPQVHAGAATRNVRTGSASGASVLSSAPLPTSSLRGSSRAFGFMVTDSHGRPAHFNRCAAVHYRVNLTGAPRGALADVQSAMSRLGRAAGLSVSYSGSTSVVPYTVGWEKRALSGGAQIYVAWSDAAHVHGLAGSVAGLGGPYYSIDKRSGREPRIVFSGVVLDRQVSVPAGFGNGVARGTLILHELGHAVNLAHVSDRYQVMNPTVSSLSRPAYQAGDQTGLNRMRAYRCF